MPGGVFSLLFEGEEDIHEIGLSHVRHHLIKGAAFTGSTRAGLALLRATQARSDPIPFFAEMGSLNPVFFFPKAVAHQGDSIVAGLHGSIAGSVGQVCTKPGLLFLIDSRQSHTFLEELAQRMTQTPSGTMLTLFMRATYQEAIDERSRKVGVRTLAQVATGDGAGATLHVTDADDLVRSPHLKEEIFGPSSLAVICRTVEDFQRSAEVLEGQLTATLWADTDELNNQDELLWTLEQKAGRIIFNGFPTGVELGSAMTHGDPFPATTDSRFTCVGTRSILRFVRPVAWQTPT